MNESAVTCNQYLLYIDEYEALICRQCECAIAGAKSHVERHFRERHKTVALKDRKKLAQFADGLRVTDPRQLNVPKTLTKPIDGIRLRRGFECEKCELVCVSETYMVKHSYKRHAWKMDAEATMKTTTKVWRSCWVQTFLPHNHGGYFVVNVDDAPTEREKQSNEDGDVWKGNIDDMIENVLHRAAQRDEENRIQDGIVNDNMQAVDRTPWLTRTGWLRQFEGRNMIEITKASLLSGKQERGAMKEISESVQRVLQYCMNGVYDLNRRNWDVIRFWLNSAQMNVADDKPFSLDKGEDTMKRYGEYWQRLICYCVRTIDHDDDDDDGDVYGVQFTPEQHELLTRLNAVAKAYQGDEEEIDMLTIEVSAKLIMHSDYEQRRSGLIHFCGVLGYNATTETWREPSDYTPMLAGMQFCMRLIMLEYTLSQGERNEFAQNYSETPEELFKAMHAKWLVVGTGTTFNYVHSLLQYGKRVAKDGRGRERVRWSEDKATMYIDGRPLSIDAFRGFVQSIIERAKAILTEELLFGDATPLETLNLFELVDDFEVSNKNHSFMSEECNEMAEGRRGMMNRLKGNKGRWDEMMQMNEERNELKFNSFKAREYESQVERFLELLLILIHITGGQPARGAEITTLRYVNWSTGTRNIFVEDGQIMIVTSYHKAQALTDKLNVIPRFLPEAVGKMLVIYLANVIPFRQLLNHRHETTETQGFLWASDTSKNKSRTWGTQRLTTCLKRESGKELGMELTTSDYRHIAKAINRMYVRGLTRGMNEEDEEEEEEDADDLQACHGKEMADDVYGIRGDILRSLTERSISVFRDVSRRWHSFLKLESKGKRTKKRSNDREIEGQLMKRTQFKVTMKEVREQLKNLYGANGTFKSKEQEAGMQAIMNNASPLIIILPTGGGKSLLFMMPTKLKGARTTIVVIPFIALIDDMLKRCKNADISCVEWKPNCNERVSIVIVSADRAVTGRFKGYAMGLHLKGQLDRIVIDESHLTLTAASYRRCMRQLKTLAIPVQLVSLTATLPPRMEKDFEEGLMIQGAQYIRASTNRRNFKYSVEGVDSMEDMQERVKEMIEGDKKKRRMIFCRSRVKCERMANILQCEVYHAGLEGRSECAKRWVTNGGPIVATGALGTGMDIEGIEEVIHMEMPYGLIDFMQEAGRAGREGTRVESKIFVIMEAEEKRVCKSLNEEWIKEFIMTRKCRREILTGHLDGDELKVKCDEEGGIECDSCEDVERHSKRMKSLQMDTRKRNEGLEKLKGWLKRLQGRCGCCFVNWGWDDCDHSFEGCDEWDIEGNTYEEMREMVNYEGRGICWNCSKPGDWCEYYMQGLKCSTEDVVIAVCLSGWAKKEIRKMILKASGREFAKGIEYMRWLGTEKRFLEMNMSWGLFIFYIICEFVESE